MGARSAAADQEQQCDTADQLIHELLPLAALSSVWSEPRPITRHTIIADYTLEACYSNGKMRRQSFFMLITVQPSFFASSYSAWVKVPTLLSGRPWAGP